MRCGTSFKASCSAWYCARIRFALYTYAGVATRAAMPRSSAGSKPRTPAPTFESIEVPTTHAWRGGAGRVRARPTAGAGPGRFTELLHHRRARVVVADLSARQLELNRETAGVRGFASSVEAWRQLDICDLGALDATSFDGVVAFGGPFSYVFER